MTSLRDIIAREIRKRWGLSTRKEKVRLLLRLLSRLVKPGGWRYSGLA